MDPAPTLPSRLYRAAVRQTLTQYRPTEGAEPEEDFLDYLRSGHATETARLESLTAADPASGEALAIKNGLFVFAAGLLAFGRLDVAEDLLDYLPSSGGIRKLALVLQALLPLPGDLHPWHDPDTIRIWLREHKDRLRWDEAQGVYVTTHDQP